MGYIRRHRINATVTATGGGAQTFYTEKIAGGGYVESIVYQKATVSGFSTAGHITITAEKSGAEIWNATTTGTSGVVVAYYPRARAQDTSAVALGFTSAATPPVIPVRIPVADEAIKIVASSGGTASNGGVRFTLDLYVSGF